MLVVRNIPIKLEISNIIRRQGIKEQHGLRPQFQEITHELLDMVDKQCLIQTATVHNIYEVTSSNHQKLMIDNGFIFQGKKSINTLASAKRLAVALCTIGPALENKVSQYFTAKEPLRGLLLDGIGSAAVDSLAQEVCELIRQDAQLKGYQTGSPFSPGMPGFPIAKQRELFQLVPAEDIGIKLTSSGVMFPRKSISMIIGIGTNLKTWTKAELCARCNLRHTCDHRIKQ